MFSISGRWTARCDREDNVSERARLILNPTAGTDTAAAHAEAVNRRLRTRYGTLEIVLTIDAGDASHAAEQAARDGCTHLFVGGGDGTLNEAINGVALVEGALKETTFGVLPLGTGNDFATALGIPEDVDEALTVLLEAHAGAVDLGMVNGRLFANISGGGFFADVSESVTPQMKTVAGRLAYLIGGTQVLLDFTPIRASVDADDGRTVFDTTLYAFAVCNSRTFGGGNLIAPHAIVDDGWLDVCVIDAMSTLEFVTLLRAVSRGTHVDDPRVRYIRAASVTFTFDAPVSINTDGEVLSASRCDYRVLPGATRFFTAPAAAGANTPTGGSGSL
jgi:diacylglycerol kinase (ATP)